MPLIWHFGGSVTRRRLAASVLPYDLVDAVVAWLRAELPGGTLPGGVHSGFAGLTSDGSQRRMPYIEIYESNESSGYQTNNISLETGTLWFNLYSISRLGGRKAADAIQKQLKDAPLAFEVGYLIYLRQSSRRFQKDPDPGVGGVTVYQETRSFSYVFSTTL
jgi:hypothetical protein